MSYYDTVAHGITFGNKHTWRDWRLVPTTRPVFDPPSPKLIEVEVPGADGVLDLTESLTGDVKYNNRTGSLEFQVENKEHWAEVYSTIMDYLHGQRLKAVLDDNPDYYYIGRFTVNKWDSNKNRSTIVLDYNLDPYKYELFSSLEKWKWDPFSFETGIIRDYKDIVVDGSYKLEIPPTRKVVVPTITVTLADENATMQVRYGWGTTYSLKEGENRISDIRISNANQYNFLTFTGRGTVSVDYQGARL